MISALTKEPVKVVRVIVVVGSPVVFGLVRRKLYKFVNFSKSIKLISSPFISIGLTTVFLLKNEGGSRVWNASFSTASKNAVQSIRQGHASAAHIHFGNISNNTRMNLPKNVPVLNHKKIIIVLCALIFWLSRLFTPSSYLNTLIKRTPVWQKNGVEKSRNHNHLGLFVFIDRYPKRRRIKINQNLMCSLFLLYTRKVSFPQNLEEKLWKNY